MADSPPQSKLGSGSVRTPFWLEFDLESGARSAVSRSTVFGSIAAGERHGSAGWPTGSLLQEGQCQSEIQRVPHWLTLDPCGRCSCLVDACHTEVRGRC